MKEWPPEGPALAWSAKDIGKGFSSAVSDGKTVYVTGMKDTSDYLSAFTLSGKLLWQIAYDGAGHTHFRIPAVRRL